MSTRLRFPKARQVFEAFPTVLAGIEVRPQDETPLDFARKLLARGRRFDAISYAACLLPRREAVWWGCRCVQAIPAKKADDARIAAETWVRDPEDASRRAALKIGAAGATDNPATWLALAAGYSGGSIAPEGSPPVPPPPHMTATYVKGAVILAIAQSPPLGQLAWVSACVEAALRFADGGDAKVLPPTPAAAKTGAA